MQIQGAVLHTIGAARPYAESRPLRIETLELDGPGPDEVLIRVQAAAVCHSDLSVVDGNRVRPVPMLLGHEASGVVEELGSAVPDLAVGQRVVMTFLPRCGECAACGTDGRAPCVAGSATNNEGTLLAGERRLHLDGSEVHHHLGVSGFATHAVVDRRSLVVVDEDVPPDVATVMGCAVLTGGGAVLNAGRPRPGETVVVMGLGGVGMAAVLTALSEPDLTVIGIDRVPAKLDRARELGAHAAYTPEDAAAAGLKAEVVIEAVGRAAALEAAIDLTAPGGRTVSAGLAPPSETVEVSPLALVAQGRTIVGSYLGSAVPSRDIPELVRRWRDGRLPVEQLVSSSIGLDDLNVAMDRLADGAELRQLITF